MNEIWTNTDDSLPIPYVTVYISNGNCKKIAYCVYSEVYGFCWTDDDGNVYDTDEYNLWREYKEDEKPEESVDDIISNAKTLLENCHQLDNELAEMKNNVDFLINEYRTNKRWFKPEGGRVTTEDVIKACFEFGWASRRNFDHKNSKK